MRAHDRPANPADAEIADIELPGAGDEAAPSMGEAMQARIVQLVIGLFERGALDETLTVAFEAHPAIQFAERLRRLLKLESLGTTLTDEILPQIRRRISFTPDRAMETHRYHVRGALDWGRTLRANFLIAASPLLSDFVVCRPVKEFRTPENLLTVLTLVRVMEDAHRVLHEASIGPHLHPREQQLIRDVIRKCRRALRPTPFPSLLADARRLLRGEQARAEAERLEAQARDRIWRTRGTQGGYQALLDWREQYERLDLTSAGALFPAPFRLISSDKTFELLVLLELLARLGRHGRVRQRGALSSLERVAGMPAFECRFRDGDEWEVFVQTARPLREHRYLPALAGIPDLIIRNPNTGRVLLGDAKYYTVSSYGAAFYKMMGYLYQFGYPGAFETVAGGVLFVPHRMDKDSGWTVWTGTREGGQALMTLVIPSEGIVARETQHDLDAFIAFARRILQQ